MANKEYEDYWGSEESSEGEVPVESPNKLVKKAIKPDREMKATEGLDEDPEEEVTEEDDSDDDSDEEETEEETPVNKPKAKAPPMPVLPERKLGGRPPKVQEKSNEPEVQVIHQPAQPERYFLDVDGEQIPVEDIPIRTFLEVRAIRKLLKK